MTSPVPATPSSTPVPPRPGVTVVVLGAGAGNRVGAGVNKVLLPLAGRPLLAWSLAHALATTGVDRVVVVAAPAEHDEVAAALSTYLPADGGPEVALVPGGSSRHGSEWAALQAVAGHVEAGRTDVVVVHDGRIVAERYADGFDADTRQLGWSMAKSVTNAMVGRLVAEGTILGDVRNDGVIAPEPFWTQRAAVV